MNENFKQYWKHITKYLRKLTQLFQCLSVWKRDASFIDFHKPFTAVYTAARDNTICILDAIEMFLFLPVNIIILRISVSKSILEICYNQQNNDF